MTGSGERSISALMIRKDQLLIIERVSMSHSGSKQVKTNGNGRILGRTGMREEGETLKEGSRY